GVNVFTTVPTNLVDAIESDKTSGAFDFTNVRLKLTKIESIASLHNQIELRLPSIGSSSECMSRCREPKDCSLLREDYLECLHHSKERTEFHALRVLETPKWARIGSISFSRQSFANE
ncbi:hypothetical protein Golax_023981, partial [Gossypium laxum]|nr:hypothetical protein [Gossypium laxum]